LLNAKKVRYLLIGGYAVSYHGYPRSTADMDIWIATDFDNCAKLISAVKEFGFDVPELTIELLSEQKKILRMGLPPIRIEVLADIDGVDFDPCYHAKLVDTIDGIPVNIINLEHLKKNKQASGRLKDLNDLEYLP